MTNTMFIPPDQMPYTEQVYCGINQSPVVIEALNEEKIRDQF